MRKIVLPLILVFCCFLLLISVSPANKKNSSQQAKRHVVQNEIYNKHTVLQKDLDLTRHLNRMQVVQHFSETLKKFNEDKPTDVKETLHALQQQHPHMVQLSWIEETQNLNDALQIGNVPNDIKEIVIAKKKEALQFLKRQHREKLFQSTPIQHDSEQEEYYVVGASSGDHGPYILGLMHQHLIKQITVEQRKNLRIVPYPSDKRYKIKSVDAETLDGVKVRNAEDNEGVSHYHIQQVVVKFNGEPTEEQLKQIQQDIQATTIEKLGYTYVFESDKMSAEQMMSYFKTWDIVFVEPHFLYMTNDIFSPDHTNLPQPSVKEFVPNDALFQQYQWNLPMIDTLRGWSLTRGSDDVIVAVIDTGVDLNHADLANNLVAGFNVENMNAPPYDDVGHGTHVSGVISAIVNNSEGVAGMSWFNKVMPVKALDHTGAGSTYSVAQGIIWATDHGAKVINMSLGNYIASEFLHDAIKYAFDHDVVLVAATGNDDTEDPGYPAAYPEVLAVAAINANQKRATFSNYGDYVDVAAPGENIASTYPGSEYAAMSGTSMASPHVAALAAMIRTANPALTNVDVMDIIRKTAIDLGAPGRDKYYGYGQIDVVAALQNTSQATKVFDTSSSLFERILRRIKNSLGGGANR